MKMRMPVVGFHSAMLRLIILAVPAASALVAFGGDVNTPMDQFMAKCGYTKVPLHWGRDNHLFANAKITGKNAICELDTGAPDLIIDTRRSGGLKPLGRTATPEGGLFGEFASSAPTVWVPRFEVSGIVFSNQEAMVWNLHRDERVATAWGEDHEAIIGMSLLRNMHAWLDCYAPRLYVRVAQPDAATADIMERSFRASGFLPVPAKPLGPKLLAEAQINGQAALLMLDTGAAHTLISVDQLELFGLSNKERLGVAVDIGGKTRDLKYTRLESLKLGEFELKQYPVGTVNMQVKKYDGELKKHDLPPLAGLLGPDILNKCRAMIDCAGGRVFLMPEKTPQ